MKYWRQLDGLRCVAVLFVLMQHFFPELGDRMHAGFIGVNLFFVLSGFLITAKLDESALSIPQTLTSFYLHRFARIIPVYYLTVIVLFIFNVTPVRAYALHCFLFIFNMDVAAHQIHLTPITHFWSLAVEMQFYLIWPFLILTLKKYNRLLMVTLVLIIMASFVQFYLGYITILKPYRWVGLFPLIFAMASGSLGYYIYKQRSSSFHPNLKLFVDILVTLFSTLVIYMQHWTMFIMLTIASVYFVLRFTKQSEQHDWYCFLLGNRSMVYLGKISYGIYLFHLPVFFCLMHFFPVTKMIFIIITTTLVTIALAALSYHLFENPVRKKCISFFAPKSN